MKRYDYCAIRNVSMDTVFVWEGNAYFPIYSSCFTTIDVFVECFPLKVCISLFSLHVSVISTLKICFMFLHYRTLHDISERKLMPNFDLFMLELHTVIEDSSRIVSELLICKI